MTVLHGFTKLQKNIPPINLLQICDFTKKDAQKAAELQLDLEKRGKIVNKTLYNECCNCIKRACIFMYLG